MDSLDVLAADPDDTGLHGAAQPAGLSGEAQPAAAAPRNRRTSDADESQLPHRPLGCDPKLSDIGRHRICLEVSRCMVDAAAITRGNHFGFRGALHRTAAVVLLASTIYHVIHLARNQRDRLFLKAMLPELKDATDLVQVFAYNLGLTKTEPHFKKFNYAEKMEYWAFMWGTVVMTVSGFLLWFNNFTLRHFPKWVSDAATAVHYYEALLATFSILIWHFYMVIFDPLVYPMDTAFINGKVPADHYRHSRPEYLRALERANLVELPTDPADYDDEQGTDDHRSADTPRDNR